MYLIKLPKTKPSLGYLLDQLLTQRCSMRDYGELPVARAKMASRLWAAPGITELQGLRTTPGPAAAREDAPAALGQGG